jgi:hypothetical protein
VYYKEIDEGFGNGMSKLCKIKVGIENGYINYRNFEGRVRHWERVV